jgi:alcohol dehydrogenase class IV
MDAAVHAVEALLVPGLYHPLCDGAALQALVKIDRNLRDAVSCAEEWAEKKMQILARADGEDVDPRYVEHVFVRQEMLVGSALAAVAFQRGLGAVHGLSEPFGAVLDTHHGLTNAVLLPHFLRDLAQQFSADGPSAVSRPYGQDVHVLRGEFEDKCAEVARVLRLNEGSSASAHPVTQVIDWADRFCADLAIPERLGPIIHESKRSSVDVASLAQKAERNQTGFGNAMRYTVEDYERVLRNAL